MNDHINFVIPNRAGIKPITPHIGVIYSRLFKKSTTHYRLYREQLSLRLLRSALIPSADLKLEMTATEEHSSTYDPMGIIQTSLLRLFAHWKNSTRVDKSPLSDTLSWFWANQSLFLLLNAGCLAGKQQISII
jgi:hypothetical protein